MANDLSPAEWKKVLKDHKDAPDTAPVTKALEAYAKAEPRLKDEPQPVLDTLKDVVDAAKDAKAANFKDKKRKPLVDFLDGVLKDAATMKVKAERALQEKAERHREGPDEDEGGDNERAKLTERLIKVKKLDAEAAKPFVLALGSKVHGLVIAKTNAISGDHKKRARDMREGNGRVFQGLVHGEKGRYIFLMDVKPPGGIAKALKKTALKHTDLPPIRVVVRGPDGAEIDDENDVEEMADLGADTEEPTPGQTPVTTPPEVAEAEVARRIAALSPRVKQALSTKAHNAREIGLAFSEAQALARQRDYDASARKVDEVEKELATSVTADPGAEYRARLAEWTPTIKAALATKGPNAAAMAKLLTQATALSKTGGDMAEALVRLTECHDLATGATTGDPAAKFNERLKSLMPAIKAAAGTPAGEEARLKASQAGSFATQEEFTRADSLLDEAEVVLRVTGVNAPTVGDGVTPRGNRQAPGLVKSRQFLLERWRQIPPEISADLKKLKGAIEKALPGEDADALIDRTEDYLDDFYGEMREAIDDDINSGDPQYRSAINSIQAFRMRIARDPLILHLKANTLKVDLTVDSILLNALAEVEKELAG